MISDSFASAVRNFMVGGLGSGPWEVLSAEGDYVGVTSEAPDEYSSRASRTVRSVVRDSFLSEECCVPEFPKLLAINSSRFVRKHLNCPLSERP